MVRHRSAGSIRALLAAATIAAAVYVPCAQAQQATTLRMTLWSGNKAHLDLFNGMAAEFKKTHPNVDVALDVLPFDTYTTTLTTQIAGGNAPDLAWLLETSAPDFVGSGILAPLQATLTKTAGYKLEDMPTSATALWSKGGEIYAVPFSTSPYGIFVNNDLIKQAGAKTPAELIAAGQWTWPQAIAIGKAVHDKTGKAGLVVRDFDYQQWDNLAAVWNGWGASPWSADGKTCTFDQPPMIDALNFIRASVFTDKAMPEPGVAADFFAGDAAMTITQISRASLLPKNGFAWDLVPLPKGQKGDYAVIGQAAIGVFKSGKHADVAADFVAFITNPDNSAKLAQFFPSARKNLLDVTTLAKTNPLLLPDQIKSVVISGIEMGSVKPSHTGYAQIAQTVRAGLDPLWMPTADVKATVTALCGRLRPLLAR